MYFSENLKDSDISIKQDYFFNLLNSQKIPFYLIKTEEFSFTISQILDHLAGINNQTSILIKENSSFSVSSAFEYQKDSKTGQKLQAGIEQSNISVTDQNKYQHLDNILFFSGFSREQVEDFLDKIRSDKYPRFPLKAVATKNNYLFSFDQLIRELTQDRIVISHVINLRKRINALTGHLAKNNTLNSQQKRLLQNEIDQAESLLKDVETNFDLKLFRTQIQKFNYLLAKLKYQDQPEENQADSVDQI